AGYVHAVAGTCNSDGLLAPVGKHKILESYTKLYNTVKCGQTAVAAALGLVREQKLDWRDIAALQIGLAERDARNQSRDPSYARPESRDTANHSVRYCVAAALVEGELGTDQFEAEKLRSPDILAVVDRSSVYWEKGHDLHWPAANPTTIRIRTSNGQETAKAMIAAPGHPDNPISDEVLEQKFRQLTRKALSADQVSEVIGITHHLERLEDLRTLTAVLRRS
ncbi:MAG: hypothetical protein ACREQW_16120, partial [Candidatus Binatia bacterium]